MAEEESAEQDVAGWGLRLGAIGVILATLALMVLPGIALANSSSRAFWVVLGIVGFVVARAKLLTMAWALIAFAGERYSARQSALFPAAPRFSLLAVTVVFMAVAIPHC